MSQFSADDAVAHKSGKTEALGQMPWEKQLIV